MCSAFNDVFIIDFSRRLCTGPFATICTKKASALAASEWQCILYLALATPSL